MNINELTVTASEIGTVLDLTDRRVRQLAEEGIFERQSRGRYNLRDCVLAYIATLGNDESDELRRERIALMKAQRRRVELDNEAREGEESDFAWQDAALSAMACYWHLRLRPIATWLFEELRKRGVKQEREIAGTVENWFIRVHFESEKKMKEAAAEARRRGIVIRGYDDMARLVGDFPGVEADDAE